jgi:hypothetical protein
MVSSSSANMGNSRTLRIGNCAMTAPVSSKNSSIIPLMRWPDARSTRTLFFRLTRFLNMTWKVFMRVWPNDPPQRTRANGASNSPQAQPRGSLQAAGWALAMLNENQSRQIRRCSWPQSVSGSQPFFRANFDTHLKRRARFAESLGSSTVRVDVS